MPFRPLPELTSKRSSTQRWNSKWRCLRTLSENTSITMQCVSLLYQLRNSKKTKKTMIWKRKWRSSSKQLTEDTQKLWVTTWLTSCSTLWASKTEKLCSHRHQSSTATFLPWIYSPYNLLSLKPMTMSSMATADLWLYLNVSCALKLLKHPTMFATSLELHPQEKEDSQSLCNKRDGKSWGTTVRVANWGHTSSWSATGYSRRACECGPETTCHRYMRWREIPWED